MTPYRVGHLGHARVFVFFDTVRRYLEFNSYEVRHIQNITDVDDDMMRVSTELGVSIAQVTDENQAIYLEEMDALNVMRPESFPKASEWILEMIEMVKGLIADGHAYEVDDYVFFDTTSAPNFGALAGLDREGLRNFESDSMPEEPEELKRDSLDFLLWQPCDYEGASFDSPWASVARAGTSSARRWLSRRLALASTSMAGAATSSTRTTTPRSCSRRARAAKRRLSATGCTSAPRRWKA